MWALLAVAWAAPGAADAVQPTVRAGVAQLQVQQCAVLPATSEAALWSGARMPCAGPTRGLNSTAFATPGPHGAVWWVTVAHGVAGAERLALFTSEGQRVPARVLWTDPDDDVAVVVATGELAGVQPLAGGAAPVGPDDDALVVSQRTGTVWAVGYADGKALQHRSGSLQRLVAMTLEELGGAAERAYWQVDAPVSVGMSGGPLVAADGRVAGMVVAGMARGGGLAVPWQRVQTVLDQAKAASGGGADHAAPDLRLSPEGVVTEVSADAARLGWQAGMVVQQPVAGRAAVVDGVGRLMWPPVVHQGEAAARP